MLNTSAFVRRLSRKPWLSGEITTNFWYTRLSRKISKTLLLIWDYFLGKIFNYVILLLSYRISNLTILYILEINIGHVFSDEGVKTSPLGLFVTVSAEILWIRSDLIYTMLRESFPILKPNHWCIMTHIVIYPTPVSRPYDISLKYYLYIPYISKVIAL